MAKRIARSNFVPAVCGLILAVYVPTAAGQNRLSGPNQQQHPLIPALQFASVRYDYVRRNVRDFTCVLVKRERIERRLRSYEYLYMKVRRHRELASGRVQPFSVYAQYLAPKELEGRKVLYVAGWNDGKLRVQKGGARMPYMKVNVSPTSELAMRESRYPITEMGFENVVRRMIEQVEDDMHLDPNGLNTTVQFFGNAKIDSRTCTCVRVMHPEQLPGFEFYLANVYVDDELHIPIRVEGYDWPKSAGESPPLLEEYTFTRLRLNVGLTDSDFSPDVLNIPGKKQAANN